VGLTGGHAISIQWEGDLSIDDSNFCSNRDGAVLYVEGSGIEVSRCIFVDNSVDCELGMQDNPSNPFRLNFCVFSGTFPPDDRIEKRNGNQERSLTATFDISVDTKDCPVDLIALPSQSFSGSLVICASLPFSDPSPTIRSDGVILSSIFRQSSDFVPSSTFGISICCSRRMQFVDCQYRHPHFVGED
jgi:hypothetical protein